LHVPEISGYEYIQWKKGLSGAPQSGSFPNPTLSSAEVIAGMDIYLIYEKTGTDVTVSKTVTGSYGNKTKEFNFTVYLKDRDGVKLKAGTMFNLEGGTLQGSGATAPAGGARALDSDGKITFTLTHGQSLTIKEVPAYGKVHIIEENYAPLYETSFTDSEESSSTLGGNTQERNMTGAPRTFAFVNERVAVPVVGVDAGDTGTIIILPLLALLAGMAWLTAGVPYRRRRSSGC
jgi:hypothetical protein